MKFVLKLQKKKDFVEKTSGRKASKFILSA